MMNNGRTAPDQILLTSKDVARKLAISERQVFALKAIGELPFIKIGRLTRYQLSDIEAYLERNYERMPQH